METNEIIVTVDDDEVRILGVEDDITEDLAEIGIETGNDIIGNDAEFLDISGEAECFDGMSDFQDDIPGI